MADATPATTQPAPAPSAYQPLIDKVGVPLIWFGVGYVVATLIVKGKKSA